MLKKIRKILDNYDSNSLKEIAEIIDPNHSIEKLIKTSDPNGDVIKNLLNQFSEEDLHQMAEKTKEWVKNRIENDKRFSKYKKIDEGEKAIKEAKEFLKSVKEKEIKKYKIAVVGNEKKIIKKLRRFATSPFSSTNVEIGVDFFFKRFNIQDLNIINNIWLITEREKFNILIGSYIKDTHVCILCLSKNKDRNLFIEIALESDLNADQIILLKKKYLTERIFKFISILCAWKEGLVDDLNFKIYKDELPSSVKILSEMEDYG